MRFVVTTRADWMTSVIINAWIAMLHALIALPTSHWSSMFEIVRFNSPLAAASTE
jgi:hypothetical protein